MSAPNRRVKGATPTIVQGIRFASKREARAWEALRLLQQAGQISALRRQVKIPLAGRDGPILTPTGRKMHYVADFVFVEDGREVIADAKGHATEIYLMKRAVLAAQGIAVREL